MLLRNIGVLVGVDGGDTPFLRGKDMDRINTIENAWLRIRDGRFLSLDRKSVV